MTSLRKFRVPLILLGVLVLAFGIFAVKVLHTPPPQGEFVADIPATDFTLNDQDGNPIHLASLRGQKSLLIFYRGYW